MSKQPALRQRVLELIERLKDGIEVEQNGRRRAYMIDPAADYDLYARKSGGFVTITLYSRYARCTIRAREGEDGSLSVITAFCRR
jgi:hypothetical protein